MKVLIVRSPQQIWSAVTVTKCRRHELIKAGTIVSRAQSPKCWHSTRIDQQRHESANLTRLCANQAPVFHGEMIWDDLSVDQSIQIDSVLIDSVSIIVTEWDKFDPVADSKWALCDEDLNFSATANPFCMTTWCFDYEISICGRPLEILKL